MRFKLDELTGAILDTMIKQLTPPQLQMASGPHQMCRACTGTCKGGCQKGCSYSCDARCQINNIND